MIRFKDASTLALTKLRTRKVRLAITVIVSGLLFTGLTAASMVARGAFNGVESFGDEGFGKRYIISGSYQPDVYGLFENKDIMARANQVHKETVAKKTAEAKRLKLDYDAKADTGPVQEYNGPNGVQSSLNFDHPAARVALNEHLGTKPKVDLSSMEKIGGAYGATNFYQSTNLPYSGMSVSLQLLKEGKEDFEQDSKGSFGPPTGIDTFTSSWQTVSPDLLDPFILPGQDLANDQNDGAIPVIAPVSAAEELLGLTKLSGSATSSDRLERIKQIRRDAGSIQFEVCARNSESSSLISQAVSTQREIEQNKTNKDYRRPSLIYGLPETACGSVTVIRDVRTAAEKQQAARQEEFDRLFGKKAPEQRTYSFRIVGLTPDFDFGTASTVGQIIKSLVTSSLGSGWFTPSNYLERYPELAALFSTEDNIFNAPPIYYAEFSNASDAKKFLDEASCNPDYSKMEAGSNPMEACRAEGKEFTLGAYGSNSLALDSAKRGFGKIFRYAALAIALIAAVIMMGTVGRMIADSRRETAVFRAIGAKRFDIAQIYILYTIMLSLLICLFALLVGALLASVVHARFSDEVTVEALVAYNAQDLNRTFGLYALYWPDLLQLFALALAGGVVSALLPLFRNLRRNPIKDMRDDT